MKHRFSLRNYALFFLALAFAACAITPKKNQPSIVAPPTIKAFTTDYCSLFPEGPANDTKAWAHCCVIHDIHYWRGGPFQEREKADQELKTCVSKNGYPGTSKLMLSGVEVGGDPGNDVDFRWGYGWPFGAGYFILNEEQKASAKSALQEFFQKPEARKNPVLIKTYKKISKDL